MSENQYQEQGKNISQGELKKNRIDQAIRRARMKLMILWGSVAVGVILIVGIIIWIARMPKPVPPGVAFAGLGQEHVALNYQFSYNSNPPTSGPHYPDPANWGIYDYEVADKIFIHNLEHGGIWISYRPNVSVKAIDDLKGIVKEFDGSQIVMGPRSANDMDIAVAAWTHLYKFNLTGDGLTDKQKEDIRTFYMALKNHGPEFVPGMAGIDPKSVPGGALSK